MLFRRHATPEDAASAAEAAREDAEVQSWPDQGGGFESEAGRGLDGPSYRPWLPPRLLIKITGAFSGTSSVTGQKYNWEEVYRDATAGTWPAMDGGRSSALQGIPALEGNAVASVTTGTVAEAQLHESGLYYLFFTGAPAAASVEAVWVKVTSASVSGHGYPCVSTVYNSATAAWADGAETLHRIVMPNGEVPDVGRRYLAKFVGFWTHPVTFDLHSIFVADQAGINVYSQGAVLVEDVTTKLQFDDPGGFYSITNPAQGKVTVGQSGSLTLSGFLNCTYNGHVNPPGDGFTARGAYTYYKQAGSVDAYWRQSHQGNATSGGDWSLSYRKQSTDADLTQPFAIIVTMVTGAVTAVGVGMGPNSTPTGIGYRYVPADTPQYRFFANDAEGQSGRVLMQAMFSGGIWTGGSMPSAPSSATDTGTQGEMRTDGTYLYVCSATNTWKRVAIAAW